MACMAAYALEADSWAETDYSTVKFSHRWTVHKFAIDYHTVGQDFVVESPPFSSGQPGDSLVWRIRVHPRQGGWRDACTNVNVPLVSGTHSRVTAQGNMYILRDSQTENNKSRKLGYGGFREYKVGTGPSYSISHQVLEKFLGDDGSLNLYLELDIKRIDKPQVTTGRKLSIPPAISDRDELSHDFNSLLKDGLFSDVTIKAAEREFKVHKAILSARSPVFRAMFEHDMQESTKNRVTIEDISPEAVEEMLTFIYSGQAPNLKKMPVDLLRAADKYDLKQLKAWSEKELADRLTSENVMETMVLADQHSATKLKTVCMEQFKVHAEEVIKTEGWSKVAQGHIQLLNQLVLLLAKK